MSAVYKCTTNTSLPTRDAEYNTAQRYRNFIKSPISATVQLYLRERLNGFHVTLYRSKCSKAQQMAKICSRLASVYGIMRPIHVKQALMNGIGYNGICESAGKATSYLGFVPRIISLPNSTRVNTGINTLCAERRAFYSYLVYTSSMLQYCIGIVWPYTMPLVCTCVTKCNICPALELCVTVKTVQRIMILSVCV